MGLRSRRVSARRTLAIVAAVLALPWLLWLLGSALGEGEPVAALIAAAVAATVLTAPLAAGSLRFPIVAGGVWLVLLVAGFLGALAGGAVLWVGAFVFLAAALLRRSATWRLGRVAAVAGATIALCCAGVGLALVLADAADEPDLEVRLLRGETITGFETLAQDEPRITSVASTSERDVLAVELADGLTAATRERVADELRGRPGVQSVRVVD